MPPTGELPRILQIHPSLRCNLRCAHCYSSSGPGADAGLGLETLCGAVDDAAAEGYNMVSLSGGEPLLYPGLGALLDRARANAMVTTVTTNGMLLDARRLAVLAGRTDLLAISLDGVPASHDRMRGSPRAFERMAKRLEGVRQSGLAFGFIFTLTRHNLHELEWVAQFAAAEGATLLHVHPLEEVGRAERLLVGQEPDDIEAAVAWMELARIRSLYHGRLQVHLDVVDAERLRQHPAMVFGAEPLCDADKAPLAELVSPLVIEADGQVVPLQYGFARRYALGSLGERRLRQLAATWRAGGYADFTAVCRRTLGTLDSAGGLPFVNWYRLVATGASDGYEAER